MSGRMVTITVDNDDLDTILSAAFHRSFALEERGESDAAGRVSSAASRVLHAAVHVGTVRT